MMRKVFLGIFASASIFAAITPAASAASPIQLVLSQGAAFSILGHSCGGIQEHVYATGFASNGYPTGTAFLETRCGGSGRDGGGTTTTYTGWATVVWTWFGETRSFAQGSTEYSPTFEATDSHGDRIYNANNAAYLETGEPPLQPPAAPTGVNASVGLYEVGESEFLRMTVGWTVAAETAGLLTSSTVTATPVNSTAPVLTTTVSPYFSSAAVSPVEPNTTYIVTVTNTDAEGTSQPSAPLEVKTPNSDGEAEGGREGVETCAQDQGKIKLYPGLSETPSVQTMTVKGELKGCNGPLDFESGTYVAKLKTTEAVTCSALQSASIEPTTTPVSFTVKWLPLEQGTSKGTLLVPLSEVPLMGVTGTLAGGPFATPTSVTAASIAESFNGASTCGQPSGTKEEIKLVKRGIFSTSQVEFG